MILCNLKWCMKDNIFAKRKWLLSKSNLKIVLVYITIFACVFVCILPLICDSWVYSLYFNKKVYEKSAESTLNYKNEFRRQEALQYISHLDRNESKRRHEDRIKSEMDLLVVVKTLDRSVMNSNPDTGYLTQTTAAIDREIQNMGNDFRVGFIICNVDPYPQLYKETRLLDKYYFSIVKHINKSYPVSDEDSSENKLQREKEKKDYVFCLRTSTNFRSSYVLMVEDDTEPYEDIFKYLREIIRDKLEGRYVRGDYIKSDKLWWAFVKLYYPERWAGFGLEQAQICELLAIGALTGSFFVFFIVLINNFNFSRQLNLSQTLPLHMCFGFGFGIILALALGRQHLMQMRRSSFAWLSMTDAPGCCTPAVLYKTELIPSVATFLENIKCKEDYGVDLALDDFALNSSFSRYLVQPNLFHHRGVYSTLTKPKNKVEFLFDV